MAQFVVRRDLLTLPQLSQDCFNCRHCQRDLGDEPLVDLGGLPCCEICLEEHAGQRPEEIPTVHNIDTPSPSGLSSPLSPVPDKFDTMSNYSSPRLPPHSPIYWSDRSPAIGAQLSLPDSPQGSIYLPPRSSSPVSDYPFSDYSETSSRPSTPNSTFSFASKISSTISDEVIERAPSALSSTSTERYYKPLKSTSTTTRSNRERTISLPSPVKPSTSPTVVERQQHRRHHNRQYHHHDEDDSSHNESDTPIPAPSARLGRKVSTPLISAVHPQCDRCHESIHGTSVQLPTGEVFHQSCFTCSKCALEFTESQFIMNLGRVYHPKCAPMTQVETMGIKCTKCSVPIVGQFIRNNGGYYHLKLTNHDDLHYQCFNCAKCDRVISPNTPFTDIKGLHYCDGCATSPLSDVRPDRTPRTRTSPVLGATPRLPILPTRASVDDLPSLGSAQPSVRPSTIFSTRTKPLPKLGGSKVCPRCQKTVGFVEETSGPRATKWHKKCLGCVGPGCRKQLDSAAIIVEDGGMWMPYCRTCHDKQKQRTQSPRFPATRVGLLS
ncbi:hypothetical protein BC936DRAFT_137792 [Jimgerdemannia flammicorona]|uniref:LIM zinc-binding domain-containing protein n=1 Tax=Jimgerdemannia flammicorona TaxID=994334 RepID=A0A433CWN4_9FUNG|nr:hypothetical protein BC936DRAFT_137792 [Jimgerdemannia flammicorona]